MGAIFPVTVPIRKKLLPTSRTGIFIHGFAFDLRKMAVPPFDSTGVTTEELLSVARVLKKQIATVLARLLFDTREHSRRRLLDRSVQSIPAAECLHCTFLHPQDLCDFLIAESILSQLNNSIFIINVHQVYLHSFVGSPSYVQK